LKYEKADFYYSKAIETSQQNDNKEDYWRTRGFCMKTLKNWVLADSFYTRAISFGTQPYGVYWSIAECRQKQNKLIDMFGNEEEVELHNWGIINCYQIAIGIIEANIKNKKASDYEIKDLSLICLDEASFYYSIGKYDKALAVLENSLKYGKLSKTTSHFNRVNKLKNDIKEAMKNQ
jgi:tetratricopeptide (TPR) repeat protein